MPTAYVLVNTEPQVEEEFLEAARRIRGVVEVHSLYGIYDFIVKIQVDKVEELKDTITWSIRRLPRIKSSVTMMVIEEK